MSVSHASLCLAQVDVARVRDNLRLLAARAGTDMRRFMPVLKADAYGHGLVPVAQALMAEGVPAFAVNTAAEGAALRQAGVRQDIVLLLGALTQDDLALAAQHNLIVVTYSHDSLTRLLTQPAASRPPLALKYNTGMTRLGFARDDTPAVLEALRSANARPVLALTHFAVADTPKGEGHTRAQAAAFATVCATLRAACPGIQTSLCNSAGALAYPELMGDIARPGECLYGGNVFDGTAWKAKGAGFAQAMSVAAPVLMVRHAPAGQPVSYGGLYTPARDERLAVLGLGYADGYPRTLSCRGEVCIAGQRAPVRGRVCMSMTLVNVSHIPDVHEGDIAWVTGGPEANAVTLDELAHQWGTIPYEVHCVLGRNRREYV